MINSKLNGYISFRTLKLIGTETNITIIILTEMEVSDV